MLLPFEFLHSRSITINDNLYTTIANIDNHLAKITLILKILSIKTPIYTQILKMSLLIPQSSNYNDNWECVLCHKICHYRGLGDLFGPYHIDLSQGVDTTSEKCKNINNANKKSKYSLLNHNYAFREIWIHEECLVWSEGVHLVGTKIMKMEEVIRASFTHNCSMCKSKGATIGCMGKRCRRKFHFNCAREGNCQLDAANFTLKCDKCLQNNPIPV